MKWFSHGITATGGQQHNPRVVFHKVPTIVLPVTCGRHAGVVQGSVYSRAWVVGLCSFKAFEEKRSLAIFNRFSVFGEDYIYLFYCRLVVGPTSVKY